MFNREHRDLILGCCEVVGDDKTMEIFNIKPYTLRAMKNSRQQASPVEYRALGIAKIADQRSLDAMAEVGRLKEAYHRFVPYLSEEIKNKFLIPLFERVIDIPPELETKEKPDRLSLADFPIPERRQGK